MRAIVLDLDDLRKRYEAGESVLSMSKTFGVSRATICKRLEQMGLAIRNSSDAMFIRHAKLTKSERLALSDAAHAKVRGMKHTPEQLAKRSAIREFNAIPSKYEVVMQHWLHERGVSFTPQKAVGPYNIDIALDESRIAVEIFGGHWHAGGTHAAGYRRRIEYLLSHHWMPVIVWVTKAWKGVYFTTDSADYIVAFHERFRTDKPEYRQEHVIRGDAKTTPIAKFKPHNGALILGMNSGNETRDAYGRYA